MKYLIAIAIITLLLGIALRLSYNNGKAACENEIAKKTLSIAKKQNDIANQPNLDVDGILELMQSDKF